MKPLVLKAFGREMADSILSWRNDPLTLAMSRSPNPVSHEEHIQFIDRILQPGSDIHLWVAWENELAVGSIRVDTRQSPSELSWMLAPEARGRGLGARLLAEFLKRYPAHYGAWIRLNNPASLKMVQKTGWHLHHTQEEMALYTWKPDSQDNER
jgi:RimJ/RimL family protein N-acetyltransferase